MCENWFESVEKGFYDKYDKYLDDLQREILVRCHDSNQRYEQIAEDLCFDVGHIRGKAAELWRLLSDVFGKGERVSRANLRGPVKRYHEGNCSCKLPPLTPFKIFISDRSNQTQPSITEQLQEALQEAGRETIIGDDWLQRNEEELDECTCFLLIVSSHSTDKTEIITQEIQKAKELRDRSDNSLTIIIIHVNSLLSLPLNHPLHQEIQNIPQLEWQSQTEPITLVREIIQCLEKENELEQLLKKLPQLEISDNWMLTYVGENQLLKLSDLVGDLKKGKIPSGYAYWGVGPTRMWVQACNDPGYHMRENLQQFPFNARQLAQYVNKEEYNFVSLGVGEGSKDNEIIKDFFYRDEDFKPREDFLYLPVDMSLDMLRYAIGNIKELQPYRRLAIQRDLESKYGMREIAHIAEVLGNNQPILYGFVGNTIANVENPEQVLNNVVQVMKPNDLLLFEAQVINDSALINNQLNRTIGFVREEYEGISFRQFALSALLQNSDLSVEPREKDSCYVVEVSLQDWKYGPVLRIDCGFKNNTERELYLTFSNEDATTLNQEETISLYRSRKFSQTTLENFVQATNLCVLGTSTHLSDKGTGFMVMMLQKRN
jgi:hypothetical protein